MKEYLCSQSSIRPTQTTFEGGIRGSNVDKVNGFICYSAVPKLFKKDQEFPLERRKEVGRKKKERGKGETGERKRGGVEPTEGETVMDD